MPIYQILSQDGSNFRAYSILGSYSKQATCYRLYDLILFTLGANSIVLPLKDFYLCLLQYLVLSVCHIVTISTSYRKSREK